MKEKRTFQVKAKRIEVSGIRMIAKIIQNEYNRLLKAHHERVEKKEISQYASEPLISCNVETRDGVRYSSDSFELFDTGEVLDTKAIALFSLKLSYSAGDARVEVAIADSQQASRFNHVEVEGANSTWVNGMLGKLKEAIESWPKQDSALLKFKWPVSVVVGILVGYGVGWLFTLLVPGPAADSKDRLFVFVMISLLTFPLCTFVLEGYIERLWPNVEIVPALEHERKLDKRRKWLYGVVGVLVIPFAISAIVNLLIR